MTPLTQAGLLALGLFSGFVGGMFGIGGGLIMVPGLILAFGFSQKMATGTSLAAQLLPVGLLGVTEFWRRGEVNVRAGLGMAIGLFIGAWIGGKFVGALPPHRMKQLYGGFLLCVGLYFLLAPAGVEAKPSGASPNADAQEAAAAAATTPLSGPSAAG